jgi:hypothetical protein
MGQTYELAGYPDPRKPEQGGPDMHLAFTRLYHPYRGQDPASEPQIALPVKLFLNIVEEEGSSEDPLEQAIADFVTIAFYFLLRVGEYTCQTSTKKTQTVQFWRDDVTFWRELPTGQTYHLASDAPLESLLAATSVTLRLSNHKIGVRDATLTHETVPGVFCPVKATARRYAASRRACPNNPFAMLCQYAPNKAVTAKHITQVLQRAAFRTTIWMEGFELDRIGTHSIRASGAMHLFLNNVAEATEPHLADLYTQPNRGGNRRSVANHVAPHSILQYCGQAANHSINSHGMAPHSAHPPTLRLLPNSPELWGGGHPTDSQNGIMWQRIERLDQVQSTEEPPSKQRSRGREAAAAWPPWTLRFAPHDMVPVHGAKRLER